MTNRNLRKNINSKQLNALLNKSAEDIVNGKMNKDTAKALATICTVVVRNAALEFNYAKAQKGKIKLEYFEPQEVSKG